MKYELFVKLYEEAKEYSDVDMYIAERGWQEWMNQYGNESDTNKISAILFQIYALANGNIAENRKGSGYPKRTGFSAAYHIPDSTIQKWEYGSREMTGYDKCLLDYTFFISFLIDQKIWLNKE